MILLVMKICSIIFMGLLFHYAKGSGPQSDMEGYNCCLVRLIAVIWIIITLATMLV